MAPYTILYDRQYEVKISVTIWSGPFVAPRPDGDHFHQYLRLERSKSHIK